MSISKKNLVVTVTLVLFVLSFILGIVTKMLMLHSAMIGYIYYLCMFIVIFFAVKVVEKDSFKNIGLDFHNVIRNIVFGIGVFAALMLIPLVLYLFGSKSNYPNIGLGQTIIKAVYLLCFVGFVEELTFRGYLLTRLYELMNSKVAAVIVSSVIFGLWHYPAGHNWLQIVFGFAFGLIASTLRFVIKKNYIIPLAIGHGLYNSYIFIVGLFLA